MKLSHSPSTSPMKIGSQKYKLHGLNNVSTICFPIMSSSADFNNGRSSSINIFTKHYKLSFVRARPEARPNPIIAKEDTNFGDACWKFLRSYATKGVILTSTSLFARALIENSNLIEWSLVFKALSGLFSLICAHGVPVGVNHIYDMETDRKQA